MLVVVLVGGALLEATADDGTEAWFHRAFLVGGILVLVSYVLLVYLPQRATQRRLRELEAAYNLQCRALTASLNELRYCDLVDAVEPLADLPEDMRRVVEGAAGALAALIDQIQASSVEVATSAMGVQEESAEFASGSSQQAASVGEVTSTMEELARTAGQIANRAAAQSELASRSEEAGDAGAAALDSALTGVETMRERIDAIAERADSLGRRSREIYRILDLITEIARETHILSLNAAIEAASAGEHGERFAAVAEEVRRLAERARESVDSVRSLLDEFSGAIRAVVAATEEGSEAAEEVLGQARSTQGSVRQLRDGLTDTARAAREISLATEEQRTASDQVAVTLREVSEVIQGMAEGLQRFAGAADRLNNLALSIQLLTQTFRLSSEHSLKHMAAGWAERMADYSGNLEAVEGLLADAMRQCPYLELIYLVDRSGIMVAFAANPELVVDERLPGSVAVGQEYADRPWFQAVAREGRAVVTALYDSLSTGDGCFTIAVPVTDHEGAISGTLGMDVNVRNWTRI
jgi:methyl-accepting chemotaxis protein